MPPAAPQPTRMRKSARRNRNAMPNREAMPPANCVYPASRPTEAPTPLDHTVCAATMMLPISDMRPPCSAFASMGSTSRSGRQRAISSRPTPKASPPASGTEIAVRGSSRSRPDNCTPASRWKNSRCRISTAVPMAATTKPAIAPTSAASAIRLDSRARTRARSRRGISNWPVILSSTADHLNHACTTNL